VAKKSEALLPPPHTGYRKNRSVLWPPGIDSEKLGCTVGNAWPCAKPEKQARDLVAKIDKPPAGGAMTIAIPSGRGNRQVKKKRKEASTDQRTGSI